MVNEDVNFKEEWNKMNDSTTFSETEIPKKRVSIGVDRLDDLIDGGLPEHTITLVSGTPGSGKTIMCFHYIDEGVKNGEKCLYLSTDERIKNIMRQAEELGFDFQTAVKNDNLKFMYIDLDKENIHREMEKEIKTGNYSRVVLDSLTPVSEMPVWVKGVHEIIPSENQPTDNQKYPAGSTAATRMHIRRIINILSKDDCTSLVTSEIPEGSRSLSRDSISEFLVDGILKMDLDTAMDRRKLTIRKMRATHHTLKPQDITITEGGIKFL
ncbi:MAG: ATPase domain-containing protein [Candidatus Thermoplasmatota archaeon]